MLHLIVGCGHLAGFCFGPLWATVNPASTNISAPAPVHRVFTVPGCTPREEVPGHMVTLDLAAGRPPPCFPCGRSTSYLPGSGQGCGSSTSLPTPVFVHLFVCRPGGCDVVSCHGGFGLHFPDGKQCGAPSWFLAISHFPYGNVCQHSCPLFCWGVCLLSVSWGSALCVAGTGPRPPSAPFGSLTPGRPLGVRVGLGEKLWPPVRICSGCLQVTAHVPLCTQLGTCPGVCVNMRPGI